MNPNHVLVIASTFPSGPDDSVPRFVYDQVRALHKARPDWRFTVLAPHNSRSGTVDRTEHEEFTELRFHYVWPRRWETLAGHGIMPAVRRNPLQLLAVPLLLWQERRAIERAVRLLRPSLVYAHWFTPQAVTGAEVVRRAGIPFVFTTHASDVAVWGRFGSFGKRIVRRVVARTERITAVSRTSLDRMRPFFTESQWSAEVEPRSAIIPMGVDFDSELATSPDALYPGKRVVLFMGRLAEKKGVSYLLAAFSQVVRDYADVVLVIAGEGPLRKKLERQALESDLGESVIFAGYTSGNRKDTLYRRADICVLPSIVAKDGDAEGLPVSLLESLAYGKPTIATRATNAGEVLTSGENGVVIESQSVDALTTALTDLLGAEPLELERMSDSARRTARDFSWPQVAERTAQYLLDPYLEG